MRKISLLILFIIAACFYSDHAQAAKKVSVFFGGGTSFPSGGYSRYKVRDTENQMDSPGLVDLKFTDYYKPGINIMMGASYILTPCLEISARFSYLAFPNDNAKSADEVASDVTGIFYEEILYNGLDTADYRLSVTDVTLKKGGTASVEFMSELRFFPTGTAARGFKPYLLGGLGIANVSTSDLEFYGTVTRVYIPDNDTLSLYGRDILSGQSETNFAFSGGAGFEITLSPRVSFFADGRYLLVTTKNESLRYLPVEAGLKIDFEI